MPNLFLGVALGLVTSIVGWCLTQVLLRVRVSFGEGISKLPSPHSACGFRYRVKLVNASFLRSIVDLKLTAYVVVHGLHTSKPDNITRVRLDMSFDDLAGLRPGRNRVATIDLAFMPDTAVLLKDLGCEEVVANERRSLEDIFALGAGADGSDGVSENYLIIELLGNDGWSGSRYFVTSGKYACSDIQRLSFGHKSSWPNEARQDLARLREKLIRKLRPDVRRRELRFMRPKPSRQGDAEA